MSAVRPKPFAFTKAQREDLLWLFKTEQGRRQAGAYLDAIEPRIGLWLAFKEQPDVSHGEIRDALNEFAAKLSAARRFLANHPEIRPALESTGSTTAIEDSIRESLEQFAAVAGSLADLAQNVAQKIQVSRGPDVSLEAWLVSMLAGLWSRVFGKQPAGSKGGVFGLFLERLSKIIGFDIGPAAVKAGMNDRLAWIPPIYNAK